MLLLMLPLLLLMLPLLLLMLPLLLLMLPLLLLMLPLLLLLLPIRTPIALLRKTRAAHVHARTTLLSILSRVEPVICRTGRKSIDVVALPVLVNLEAIPAQLIAHVA